MSIWYRISVPWLLFYTICISLLLYSSWTCRARTTVFSAQQTQTICIPFIQCWPNVFDVGPTLYKNYTNILCLLGVSGYVHVCLSALSWFLICEDDELLVCCLWGFSCWLSYLSRLAFSWFNLASCEKMNEYVYRTSLIWITLTTLFQIMLSNCK